MCSQKRPVVRLTKRLIASLLVSSCIVLWRFLSIVRYPNEQDLMSMGLRGMAVGFGHQEMTLNRSWKWRWRSRRISLM
jgi:hypothetical protein